MNSEQVKAALHVTVAVGDAIRQAGSIPAGELYAVLMEKFDGVAAFERCVGLLKGAGVVREENHRLYWVEPKGAA
jgi:hypothetical protein